MAFYCHAQEFPRDEKGNIQFQEVIELPQMKPNGIIGNAEKWAVSYLSTPNILSKTEDKIIIKVADNSKRGAMNTYEVFFDLVIEGNDGKYRYTLKNFEIVEVGLMKYPLEKRIGKKQISEFVWSSVNSLTSSTMYYREGAFVFLLLHPLHNPVHFLLRKIILVIQFHKLNGDLAL